MDIGDIEFLGCSFVALSKLTRFEQIYLSPFDFERYLKIGKYVYSEERLLPLNVLDAKSYPFHNYYYYTYACHLG